jgi:hypothetical protein
MHRGQNDTLDSMMSQTKGKKAFLVSDIEYVSITTGVNWSIFGYMSSGEMVPDVMTTLLKRSKMGLMAMAGSRQVKWKTGFGTVALSVSKGSRMSRKPMRTSIRAQARTVVNRPHLSHRWRQGLRMMRPSATPSARQAGSSPKYESATAAVQHRI